MLSAGTLIKLSPFSTWVVIAPLAISLTKTLPLLNVVVTIPANVCGFAFVTVTVPSAFTVALVKVSPFCVIIPLVSRTSMVPVNPLSVANFK